MSPEQTVESLIAAAAGAVGAKTGEMTRLRTGNKSLGPEMHVSSLERAGVRELDTIELVAPTLVGGASGGGSFAINDDDFLRSSVVVHSEGEDEESESEAESDEQENLDSPASGTSAPRRVPRSESRTRFSSWKARKETRPPPSETL